MIDKTHAEYYEADSFWEGDALKDPANQRRIETTVRLIPNEVKSILDVGCGNGIFGHTILRERSDIQITGVDRSRSALKHVTFKSHIASIDDLPFEDKSFDAVSCLQVIEHIPNSYYMKSLAELARVSREFIVIGVPFEEDLANEVTECPQCKTVFNINLHLRNFNIADIDALFSEFGFKLVNHKFPMQKVRAKYIDEWAAAAKRGGKKDRRFLSPVCPVCAYTEGDKTAFNNQPAMAYRSTGLSMYKRIMIGALKLLLPKETVKGYWVVALYKRSSFI